MYPDRQGAHPKDLPFENVHGHSRPFFAYNRAVSNVRSCLVSFTDSEGIEHSVRVPAESLHETAIKAIAAFKHSVLAEMPFGPARRLTIRVKAPEEEHTIFIGKVLSWLDGGAASPSEQVKKNRFGSG